MRPQEHKTVKLPRTLLEEIGTSVEGYDSVRKKRNGPANRKELRKAARNQKKHGRIPAVRDPSSKNRLLLDNRRSQYEASSAGYREHAKATSPQPKPLKSILKVPRPQAVPPEKDQIRSPSPPPKKRQSRGVRDKFAEDDAEILALERALGVKGNKKLPKSFETDGLESLLEDINDAVGLSENPPTKRKRDEEQAWLARKRQRSQADTPRSQDIESGEESETNLGSDSGENSFEGLDASENSKDDFNENDENDDASNYSETEVSDEIPITFEKQPRENPYVAPGTDSASQKSGRYIPPSLRAGAEAPQEDLSRLRRHVKGLLNRLSEANMIAILNDVEKLYRDHPRQHISTTLFDLLIDILSDPSTLQDTFIILHAGFITALYKTIGSDFGAQAIQRIHKDFESNYNAGIDEGNSTKVLTNLMSLIAELYNFQVVASNLIYDLIRLFLDNLSERTTELLLKVIRIAGTQLRQDDPSSLKNIIRHLQNTVAGMDDSNISVRTKFMIETMGNLKNNRMKTGVAASLITSEHTIRMKRILGSLNQRHLRATEPLRVGLRDLRETEKRGKWWLVGASYKDDTWDRAESNGPTPAPKGSHEEETVGDASATDLIQIAKEQRMNTDVRRSIFIAIMSSTDYNDAYVRLMKLRLKKIQQLEMPKVLIHCAGAEQVYNPFYTFLSRRLCSDKKLKMAFQFSLWDIFKQLGEGGEDAEEETVEDDTESLSLRSLVNLAKMFGILVAEGGLGLGILKKFKLAYLQPKTRTFVELLLITAILHSQQNSENSRDEKALVEMFLDPKEMPEMAGGLRYFLKSVVSKTDVAGSKSDKATVIWGCKVASDTLKILNSGVVADD